MKLIVFALSLNRSSEKQDIVHPRWLPGCRIPLTDGGDHRVEPAPSPRHGVPDPRQTEDHHARQLDPSSGVAILSAARGKDEAQQGGG